MPPQRPALSFHVFDYQQAIDRFAPALAELRDHIRDHDLIADGPEVVAEIGTAPSVPGAHPRTAFAVRPRKR